MVSILENIENAHTNQKCTVERKQIPTQDREKQHRYLDIVFYLENERESELCFEVVSKDDRARDADLIDREPVYDSMGISAFVVIVAEVNIPGFDLRVIVYS